MDCRSEGCLDITFVHDAHVVNDLVERYAARVDQTVVFTGVLLVVGA